MKMEFSGTENKGKKALHLSFLVEFFQIARVKNVRLAAEGSTGGVAAITAHLRCSN